MNVRLVAARVIDEVTNGRSLADVLDPALKPIKDPRDRAFVQAICYGVCRYYMRLDVILSHLLKKPMNAKDSDVHALLLVGLYQLIDMRVPPHAAVAETVNATDKLRKPWARGLINAILREYLRNAEAIAEKIKDDSESDYAHPLWWITAIKKAWPNEWETILHANNNHPPFALRVNQQHLSREDYLKTLDAQGLSAQPIPETDNGILLDSPVSTDELPGFTQGDVSVQDGAAQIASSLLELVPGQHVLDACAAPGGKLTHLLEIEPALERIVAVEKDRRRMEYIQENIARVVKENAKKIECICADAADIGSWWDGQLFDRILLDAPCSASGVIRRHPDIKLLRQPQDIKALSREQIYLLDSLWPTLKNNGLLLYVTCSIFPEENVSVLQHFLKNHPDAEEDKINSSFGLACEVGRQILPGMHGMDGFYYARLRKR